MNQKLKPLIPYLSLPLILLLTLSLWQGLPEDQFSSVYSSSGKWDLREFNFTNAVASLYGRVETIHSPLLTPEEFAQREDEAALVYPRLPSAPATVRVRILVPYDEYYAITRISTGPADRIYVNGEWLRDVGNSEDGLGGLFSPAFTFTAKPSDGVIEIVHQQSNFIYHVHGVYRGGAIDEYYIGNAIRRVELNTSIILGILLSLAVVSLLLFLLLYKFRPAVLFSLLCFAWFLYTGAMGARVFVSIAPWLTDPLRFRLMTIITPVTPALVFAIIADMFPGIFHKYYLRSMVTLFSAWTVYFMFADIGFILSHALWICMGMAAVAVTYGIAAMIRKLRDPDVLQTIFVAGVIIVGYASVRDIFTYLNINVPGFGLLLPPFEGANFARIGAISFLFCQAAAIFITTMRKMTDLQDKEKRLAAENATKESLLQMRSTYFTDLSHDTKTPLTVISVHVQRAAHRYKKNGGQDEIIIDSLKKAQGVVMQVAHMHDNTMNRSSDQESVPLKDTEESEVNTDV
ncbi:MAG: hypothetical protein FWE32_06060 [Oscillospiraceae bacterium]|nr:hypothetical protein [Oscillospiraceae bacterium]